MYLDFFVNCVKNILKTLYTYGGMAPAFAVVFMFAYMKLRERGLKETVRLWVKEFKENSEYRRIFVLAFYSAILLGRTVFCRDISAYPLGHLLGAWLHDENGRITTTGIENIILFIPMSAILIWALYDRLFGSRRVSLWRIIKLSTSFSFIISLSIEFVQLMLKSGRVQISDLVFNTAGGLIGGVIYYIIYKIKHKGE